MPPRPNDLSSIATRVVAIVSINRDETCAFQRAFKGRGVAGGVNVQQRQKIVKLNSRYDDRVRKFLLGHPARVSNAFSEDDRFYDKIRIVLYAHLSKIFENHFFS